MRKPHPLPSVPLGQKCVLMLPKECQPVLMDTAQDGQGRRAQELSHFSLHTHFWGSRRSELCKSLNIYLARHIKSRKRQQLSHHPYLNTCVALRCIKGIFGCARHKAKKVDNPCPLTPQLRFLLSCFTSPEQRENPPAMDCLVEHTNPGSALQHSSVIYL